MPINNFLLPGAKFTPAYEVANSCRFNDGDSPYLSKTYSGSGNKQTQTISVWVKRTTLGNNQSIFSSYASGSSFAFLRLRDDDKLQYYNHSNVELETNRLFRDPSAWYHIVVKVDTTQATEGNRVKIYVNGTEETSFATATYPSQNAEVKFADDDSHEIGRHNTSDYFDGYMSEFVFVDGQALTPTSFGEFDEDSPRIWKPKNVSGLSLGTNGFYLDFEDSSDLGADAKGSFDFTANNLAATDQTTDTPTNNFCTINPLDYYPTRPADAEGNTVYNKSSTGDTHNSFANCTIAVTAGKWYYELKVGDGNGFMVGWVKTPHGAPDAAGAYASDSGLYVVKNAGEKIVAGSETGSAWNTVTTNDIIGLAYDFDNLKFYISKNGTWENSGDPTSGATGTGSFGNIAASTYVPMIGNANYNATSLHYFNFGNPAFSISSGNADANGYGNFEYAVPSGYLALCTKNLGSDGG